MAKRIGYSCWGFLGNGVVDTPDGGRSHRSVLIKGLIHRGHQVIMLQSNRDELEAGESISLGQTYDSGFPSLDVLFLEWRWLVPGRNDVPNALGYTPDLCRQRELVQYYASRVPIVVWDKDQQLAHSPQEDRMALVNANTYVLEPSLYPSAPDRTQALIPLDPSRLNTSAGRGPRDIDLIYIGNQYDRFEMYMQYLVDAARYLRVDVYGKWTCVSPVTNLFHHGRIAFSEVLKLYQRSVATVLLAPRRYMRTGQFTQRIFEAVSGGCLPLVPAGYAGSSVILPSVARVCNGADVAQRIRDIKAMPETMWQTLLRELISGLEPFQLNHTLDAIEAAMDQQTTRFQDEPPVWECSDVTPDTTRGNNVD
jgi:hypothetical protein